jgi:radical SAM protein with 4Fe4S-binding SPASM domain
MEYKLSLDNIDKILNEIKINFPNTNIVLSGGEPTLHNDFLNILAKSCELFTKITINTNGTTDFFRTHEFLELINQYKIRVQFSLDGYKTLHDKVRGNNNYYKTLQNILFCSQFENISLTVASTVTNIFFLDDFDSFYNDLKGISNLRWTIKRVSYSGEADIKNYDYLDNDSWNSIVEKIKLKDKNDLISIFKTFDFELLDSIEDIVLKEYEKTIINNCGSGKEKIYIYPNMDVLACTCYEKYPSGNLTKSSLKDILSSSKHLNIICQIINNDVCNNCRYKKLCNGGCLGAGFFTYNKHNIADIKCPKIYESKYI